MRFTTTFASVRYIIWLLPLLMFVALPAQPSRYFFEHLTTRDGLSQNDVNCILEDETGFMWFGTNDGLNRYDGYEFKIYRPNKRDSSALISNLVQVLESDHLDRIWIGTAGEGISCFLPKYQRFVNLEYFEPSSLDLNNDFILDLMVDSKQRLWICTANGLSLYQLSDTYEPSVSSLQNLTSSLPEDVRIGRMESIFEDDAQNIWVGSSRGLLKLSAESDNAGKITKEQIGPRMYVRSITQDQQGRIIVGAQNGLAVVFKAKNGAHQVVKEGSVSRDRVISVGNTIWTASAHGLARFYLPPNSMRPVLINTYTSDLMDAHSLSKTVLRTIYASESGAIWIGTNGGGVNKFEPEHKIFFHYKKTLEPGTISYDKIRSVFEDKSQNLWIGTEGGGLNVLPYQGGEIHAYQPFQHLPSPPNVFSLTEYTHRGTHYLLVGGQNTPGLYRTPYPDAPLTNDADLAMEPLNWVNGSVFALLNTEDRFIWAGTYANGLYRVDLEQPHATRQFLPLGENGNTISSHLIRSLMQDQSGNIWIGTGRGLNFLGHEELEKEEPLFRSYLHNPRDPHSIHHNYILALFQAKNGTVWVGTFGGGLNKFIPDPDGEGGQFVAYTEASGLPNNVVKGIQEDDHGFLWLSTNRGLTRFDPRTEKFDNFDTGDGLQSDEFSELASCRRQNGDMIFGGVNGFNVFKPDSIHINPHPPKLALTEFQVWNKQVHVGESFNGRIILDSVLFQTQDIHLKHHENSFSLGFAAFHYRAPVKNKFAYKMKGLHKDWVYVDANKRFANFTNLDPGTYIFEVKAANSDGIWTKSPISITIHIAPPFWMTWWAFIIYGLVLTALIWMLAHYTVIGIREKHQLVLEHLEKEKNEELQHMKLRFFTNISHELRTPLSLISGPIEYLMRSGKELTYGQREKQYQLISKNSEYLLRLVNQLLDFRKVDQGIVKLQVGYHDIARFVREISEPFEFIASKKKISFEIEAESTMAWFDPGIVEKTIYNLLSNAFKYTQQYGCIKLTIREVSGRAANQAHGVKGRRIEIEVSDSGVGVAKKNREKIFERFYKGNDKAGHNPTGVGIGLAYTREIVKVHHGAIWVEDNEPQGARFVVALPQGEKVYAKREKAGLKPLDAGRYAHGQSAPSMATYLQMETAQAGTEEDQAFTPLSERPTMLIVDDNPDIRDFLRSAFSSEYQIMEAVDGEMGLALALEHTPHMIISDVMMPGKNGIELCEELKEDQRTSHIPIILLTAKTAEETELEGLKHGADAFIRKPFKLDILRFKVQNIFANRAELQKRFRRDAILEPTEVAVTSTDELFLQKAVEIIEERMTDPEFNVEELAREIAMSRSKLYLKLKALTGQSSSEFIRTIRLKRAVQLLESSDLAVKEVMFMTGFNTASYFSKCFKKQFGVVPKDYTRSKRALAQTEETV